MMDQTRLTLPPKNKCMLHKQVFKKNTQQQGDVVVNIVLNSPLSNEQTTAHDSFSTSPGLDFQGNYVPW